MTLGPGSRLGPYEVLSPLGAGGMGEVWRARDGKLNRDVAIKVLPARLSADPEALSRFEREARAVAALSHPNILSIFDFGTHEGISYAVMELLEGETLRAKLDAGPITQKQAVDYALQVARGLSAAHEKGIVHRDLKPENLFVSKDGHVKILDFGLAKRVEAVAPGEETSAPTGSGHTEPGTVMGTAGYMSPEQVRGLPVDHRSDIFSFGTILYELLSGKRAFKRETNAETMAAIMRDQPPELSESGRNISPALDRLVTHCLEKDRDHRFQSARDIAFNLSEQSSPAAASGAREIAPPITSEGFWVAVLPFKYGGANADLAALADGLSEEIATGLSRFSYLRVISRSATVDSRSAGKQLGARYVMEGSLRQAGTKLRLAVQLVDATSGAHLWAENFERTFSPETVFELQDDLVPRIVSTVADMYGVLPRSMSEALRGKADEELSPHEAVLRAFGYMERVTPEEHARVRRILERAVSIAPNQSDAWAMLANLYWEEHAHGFNPQPDPLGRALAAARRAVEAAPSNNLAHYALACTLFFQKDFLAFRSAAERAIELNRMDASVAALIGNLIAYAGDWERGIAVVESAMQLNPHHPGWYWFANFNDAYRQRDYRGALGFALKINTPGNFYTHAVAAAAYGQLGMREEARKALQELLAIRPDFAKTAREECGRWLDLAFVEHIIEGLRKAGLEIAPEEESAAFPAPGNISHSEAKTESGAARAEEGFWVAVLPFKFAGANAELKGLADGLSEEIVTGLSRFSYLRVIARGSTAKYSSESGDVRAIGKELGARYVMEGSLRQAGTKLRLAVQLVDAVSGAHLWAESYERAFDPEAAFELQDDLVPRIVSTCADRFGVLARSISDAVRSGEPGQLGPYEALMRGFGYHQRLTAVEHAEAREALERAVDRAPSNADCWAMLSWIYSHEHAHGFNVRPGSLERALAAARRAVDIAPSNQLAQQALAVVLFFRKETAGCLSAAERSMALNPLDGSNEAIFLITFTGHWERGCALIRRAMELNPHHPRWYGVVLGLNEYRLANYRAAVDELVKANAPDVFWTNMVLAAAHGQLGELTAARNALRDLLALKEDFAPSAGQLMGKWFDPKLVGHLLEGLRKAGLGVPEPARADPVAKPDPTVAIAVLPFSDLSPAKDQEYLCEGMAEEIMNALVRIDGIRVASRTSAFRARRDGGDLSEIARALSVGHVLEGSVRTSGSRLRVTAQLTDVASGYQLWSERYDRDAADVFAVQDEIAAGVVEAVQTRLAPGERTVRARPQVGDLEAYRHYLKGRHLRYTKNDHGGALLCFEQATALDPSHGPSWVGLADVSVLAAAYGLKPSREAYAAAKAALQTAAGLQGESAEALYVEGMIAFGERRWKDSERLLARATQVEPGHVQARCWTANLLCLRGQTQEAILALERAREIDPLAPYPYAMTGLCLLQARRPEETGRFLDQALAFDGDNILALWVSGAAQTARGLFDPAIARLERALALSNRGAFIHGTLGWALAAAGRAEDASAVLAALRARPAPATTALPEAWMLAALGDREGAWQVLDRACDEKQLLVPFTGLPGFDPLRADPRFAALQERLGLPSAREAGPT